MDSESVEELNVNYKELRSLVEILEKRIQQLEMKAAQLAGTFVIFSGIMYIQVFIPSAALQGKRWIPVSLSASVSVCFWLTFITTVNDCLRFREQQDFTFVEQERLYRKIYSIRTGRSSSQNDGGGATSSTAEWSLTKSFAVARYKRYAYVGAVHTALLCFTLIVLYAITCIPRQV